MALTNKSIPMPEKWLWMGRPSEELAMTYATLTMPYSMHPRCDWFAPVITQDDNVTALDRVNSSKLMISINGVETWEQANESQNYVCISEEITKRYIDFYNQIVNEINQNSSLDLYPWSSKVFDMNL